MNDSPSDAPARAQVLSAEQARRAALIGADLATLDRLHAHELMWVHSSGRVDDKASLLDQVGSGRLDFLGIESREDHVRLHGTTAVLTYDAVVSLQTPGGAVERRNRVCVVWAREDGAWRAVHWQSTGMASH